MNQLVVCGIKCLVNDNNVTFVNNQLNIYNKCVVFK